MRRQDAESYGSADRTMMPSLRDSNIHGVLVFVSGPWTSRPWLVHVVLSGLFRFKTKWNRLLSAWNFDLEILSSIHANAVFGADVVQRESADHSVVAVVTNHQVELERTIFL